MQMHVFKKTCHSFDLVTLSDFLENGINVFQNHYETDMNTNISKNLVHGF